MKGAKQIAIDTLNWWANAVGDMAYEMVNGIGTDDEIKSRIQNAKDRGVADIEGWLADVLYSDEEYFSMIADHIADECQTNNVNIADVYCYLAEHGSSAISCYARKRISTIK